jgi:DNA replication protein DnaC
VVVSTEDFEGRCACTHPTRQAAVPIEAGDDGLRRPDFAGMTAAISTTGWLAPTPAFRVVSDEELIAEHESERASAQAAQNRERWLRTCPARFHDLGWSDLDQPAATLDALRDWSTKAVAGAERAGSLLLLGDLGVGKTLASLLLGRDMHEAGRLVRFCPVVELLEALRPDGGAGPADFTRPDVLILDDLGAEKPSEWVLERLYLIVNRRWLDCRPTIVTTNMEPPELKHLITARTYDRLLDDGTAIRMVGESRRHPR